MSQVMTQLVYIHITLITIFWISSVTVTTIMRNFHALTDTLNTIGETDFTHREVTLMKEVVYNI